MITTLTGDNSYLILEQVAKTKKSFLSKYDELGLERLDAEEVTFERLKEALLSPPFFVEHKLVIIKNAGANKEFMEQLEQIIDAIPDSTDTLLVIPKIDKRAKYAKVLKERTQLKEFGVSSTHELSAWVVSTAKELGATIQQADALYLVERVGSNQATLRHELEKLVLVNPTITRDLINEHTELLPQSTVFELLDAAFAGNYKKALAIYEEQRRLRVEPLAILGMVAWQLHILAIVATAKDKTPGDIAKEAKVHPFVVNKSKNALKKLSYSRLKGLVSEALELDIRLKSKAIYADDAMRNFLLSCSTTISS
jgi:DNA polymerase-3 subunit delta